MSFLANPTSSILVFGAMHMDKLAHCIRPFMAGVSNPVKSEFAVGGVGFNIARNLKQRRLNIGMVSCVGEDPDGRYVKKSAEEWSINIHLVQVSKRKPTATYTAILNNDGELAAGLSEMDIYDLLSVERLEPYLKDFYRYPYWVIDANLPAETIEWLGKHKGDSKILAAPVSVVKAERWQLALENADVWIGNGTEATVLSGVLVNDAESAQIAADKLITMGPKLAVITLAADGVVVSSEKTRGHWFIPPTEVKDVNGAGDSFFAGFTAALSKGFGVEKAASMGISVASLTTENDGPVIKDLSDEMIEARMRQLPDPVIL
ncbi:carbohydrate kinase family protein [Curvivirga sp.]|uniref:carbohydrate kinase family protein n=1 Tax=Curvivirga sp. TaxID=2856848 RepID=UPI003B5CAB70